MIPYKKDGRGHLVFEGGNIQEVALSDLLEAVTVEFNGTPLHELVFSGWGSGSDSGKLRVGPISYRFQDLKDSVQSVIRPFETLGQVVNEAIRFPEFRVDKTIVFYGRSGELCISMKK